ncbi:7809_t:CDS:2 [Entrophospora sp. SA101]|nr:14281_t:CDS:2 [Entrophospora sp. SA101]CAJ0841129.1 7809_t:CDS:2 [Entrophospora sp. SA101]
MDRKRLESLNGEQLIQEAARLISEEEIEEAVKIFTYLTERLPDAYLPLLSEKLLKLKNIPINEELAPGNSTLHSVAYIRMAKCYKELGKIEEAEKLIKKRVELEKKVLKPKEIENKSDELDEQKEGNSNNIEKLRLEGNEYYKQEKYKESCEKYLQALKINSNHLLSHSNLALVLTKLGNYDEALKHSDKCIQLDSKWAKGYYRKGNILFEQKKFEEAIKNYQLAESYGV